MTPETRIVRLFLAGVAAVLIGVLLANPTGAAIVLLTLGGALVGLAVEKARAADAPRYRREGDA